jgi:hypothetical protein
VLDGYVFEQTPHGQQPISGASVILDFTGGMGWAPSARTVSDARGHYVLCNVVDVGFGFYAFVTRPGYREAFVQVTVRAPGTFDIELQRQ